eukprot:1892479-Pleurochrysis_carterae.AAC.1
MWLTSLTDEDTCQPSIQACNLCPLSSSAAVTESIAAYRSRIGAACCPVRRHSAAADSGDTRAHPRHAQRPRLRHAQRPRPHAVPLCARALKSACTRVPTDARTHAHARARTRTHAHLRAHSHTRAYAHAQTSAHDTARCVPRHLQARVQASCHSRTPPASASVLTPSPIPTTETKSLTLPTAPARACSHARIVTSPYYSAYSHSCSRPHSLL